MADISSFVVIIIIIMIIITRIEPLMMKTIDHLYISKLGDENLANVKMQRGYYIDTPLAVVNAALSLADCVLACMNHVHCFSGGFVIGTSMKVCILYSTTASHKVYVIQVPGIAGVYFSFEGYISLPVRFFFHHGFPPSVCGLPSIFGNTNLKIPPIQRGMMHRQKRIIGGFDIQPYSQPWLGQVVRRGQNVCGATLFAHAMKPTDSGLWAVSAAHCFTETGSYDDKYKLIDPIELFSKIFLCFKVDVSSFGFLFGAYDLRFATPHMVHHKAVKIFLHVEYARKMNDIALIKFEKAVKYNAYVRPACLPPDASNRNFNTICKACGYGVTNVETKEFPISPKCVDISVSSGSSYTRITNFDHDRNIISTSIYKGFRGSHAGDSGGPVMCNLKTIRNFIVGIIYANYVSDAFSCGFYVYLPMFVEWVQETSKDDADPFVQEEAERERKTPECWPMCDNVFTD